MCRARAWAPCHASALPPARLLITANMSLTRPCTFRLPLRGFEVPQQPVEGLLIHAMGLPALKVANVPGITNQRRPACLQGHDRVVNPDRKEDGGASAGFPVLNAVSTSCSTHWLATDALDRTRSSLS